MLNLPQDFAPLKIFPSSFLYPIALWQSYTRKWGPEVNTRKEARWQWVLSHIFDPTIVTGIVWALGPEITTYEPKPLYDAKQAEPSTHVSRPAFSTCPSSTFTLAYILLHMTEIPSVHPTDSSCFHSSNQVRQKPMKTERPVKYLIRMQPISHRIIFPSKIPQNRHFIKDTHILMLFVAHGHKAGERSRNHKIIWNYLKKIMKKYKHTDKAKIDHRQKV